MVSEIRKKEEGHGWTYSRGNFRLNSKRIGFMAACEADRKGPEGRWPTDGFIAYMGAKHGKILWIPRSLYGGGVGGVGNRGKGRNDISNTRPPNGEVVGGRDAVRQDDRPRSMVGAFDFGYREVRERE